ncbi:integrase, catalytic region, zinc finger, CCHC-type containing protein [Tanacetum coccineum]
MSDCTTPVNNSNVIAPGMFNLDMPPLFPKFRRNRKARVDYLKQTKEHADTLRELVKHARTLKPLDNLLDNACKFTTRIQELRKSSTNASRSKPRSNTRNNRIKSSLNKTNHVSVCNANIKNGVLNANFEFVCSTCNECLFSASHDMYVVDYLNDVNASDRAKSKRAKKNDWKPTEGVDLLTGSRGTNLYTLSLDDMLKSSPICLLSKASKTESWLWHQRLSHLNFGTINELAKQGLVRDNGTEFVNQTLESYYEDVGISHQSSVARTPQQNDVVKRQNRTLA